MDETVWDTTRNRCFFMHIPKTGGMTLRRALMSQYHVRDKMPAERWSDLKNVSQPLSVYKLYIGHFRAWFRELLPDDVLSFTILRDPVERTISHLKHLSSDPQFHSLYSLAKGRDLRSLISDPVIALQCTNTQVSYLSRAPNKLSSDIANLSLLPEDHFVEENDLQFALGLLDKFAFVGFFENLSESFERLCHIVGLHPPSARELPLSNTSASRGKSSSNIDPELREIIADANKFDMHLYRTAKEKFQAQHDLPPRTARIESLYARGISRKIRADTKFDLAGPLPATGIWFQESVETRFYRWTGPSAEFTVEVVLLDSELYDLQLKIRSIQDVGKLSAFVDFAPIPIHLLQLIEQEATIELPIKPNASRSFTSITLSCEKTISSTSEDDRSLGFTITSIKLLVRSP